MHFSSYILKILLLLLSLILLALMYWYRVPLWENMSDCYSFFKDREQIKDFIASFGYAAPVVFILFQILQVVFAPVPGELSGVVGGYLFGTGPGFLFSSIGLATGSWLNFTIGKFMGKSFVRKIIPAQHLEKLDRLVKPQGVMIMFFLFVFPGFPKDYLCLFLGLSPMPMKTFIIVSGIGRMPGTLMLSFQGAALFDKTYVMFVIVSVLCLVFGCLAYRFRKILYDWIERFNNNQ
jgi:uncharacterized membrane protein YdjX (TVP38/TMEM64 family)